MKQRAGTPGSCCVALAHASNGNPITVRFLKRVFAGGFPGVRLSVVPTDLTTKTIRSGLLGNVYIRCGWYSQGKRQTAADNG